MIQNKVVADLLQHRAEVLAACATRRTRGDTLAIRSEELLTAFFSILYAPAVLIPAESIGGTKDVSKVFTPDGKHFALPFDKVVFVYDTEDGAVNTVMLVEKTEPAIHATMFCKFPKMPWGVGHPVRLATHGMDVETSRQKFSACSAAGVSLHSIPERTQQVMTGIGNEVAGLISIVNSMGVARMRAPIVTDEGASLQVASKSKALWEYHEVKLSDVPGYISQPKGGTHASPRWHMRRGHWRQYKTGKRVWIENMEVGDKKRGVVAHDYVVTANHMEV